MIAAIVHCEGWVLRNLRHGETSRIATLFTRELGKIGVIAKGAREPRSHFGASLEFLTRSTFIVQHRPGRDLQFLRSASLEEEFPGLLRSWPRYRLASALAEFLDRVVQGEEAAGELYDFSLRALRVLESAPAVSLHELFRGMQLRIASLLGYAPRLEVCLRCGRTVPAGPGADGEDGAGLTGARGGPSVRSGSGRAAWLFLPGEGGALCSLCARDAADEGTGVSLTPRALRRLRAMALGPGAVQKKRDTPVVQETSPVELAPAQAWLDVLDRLVEEFLVFHFDSYRGLRTLGRRGL